MRIAFAGNPNSGKTTLFNALTGRNEYVGNWAGVTVDKKQALIKRLYAGRERLVAVDLPGAYSMSAFTAEESVTSEYVKNENPDVLINIVDATNLSRSLFFTTQLLELGIPTVVALNKSDINRRRSTVIDAEKLSALLGCPVVETAAASRRHEGLDKLIRAAVSRAGEKQEAPYIQPDIDLTDRAAVQEADRARFAFVSAIVSSVEQRCYRTRERNIQDSVDAVLANPVIGLGVFAFVMFLVFDLSQSTLGPRIADWLTGWIDLFGEWVSGMLVNADPLLASMLVDGIIGGVSAVIGFLPLVMVMYFLIALLEDCGYMARATVVLDPIFKRVGLSGKSAIPFVIGTGCAIPGVMAARTIRNERERRATAMLAPFMPCGAKLPVIALFSGAFFADSAWVGTAMYFAGIGIILLGALLVNRVTGTRGRKSFFIIELPEYRLPSLKRAFITMVSRGWAYIVKAGTVILLCNFAVHLMQTFNWNFQAVEEGMESTSILATVAQPFAYILIPVVGFHAWQLAAAAVTGFIAKENVVGTLAVCYGISNLISTEELAIAEGASGSEIAAVLGLTRAAALAYLMFNLFTPPCFAAIGAMNAELKDKKWLWGGIGLQLGTGYTVAFLVYQVGTLIETGSLGAMFPLGAAIVAVFVAVLVVLCRAGDRVRAAELAAPSQKIAM